VILSFALLPVFTVDFSKSKMDAKEKKGNADNLKQIMDEV
jgi:hypothetical protein